MSAFLIFIIIVVVIAIYAVSIYKSLVRISKQVKNAWSQIDVQLKRRHDLIPNLIETVKGYMTHERDTLENITKAIVPIENEDNITLHLTWKIPILYSDFIGWHVYFDVMTGEIVNITQEFMT